MAAIGVEALENLSVIEKTFAAVGGSYVFDKTMDGLEKGMDFIEKGATTFKDIAEGVKDVIDKPEIEIVNNGPRAEGNPDVISKAEELGLPASFLPKKSFVNTAETHASMPAPNTAIPVSVNLPNTSIPNSVGNLSGPI
jgi:hypothetical protein